MTLVKSNIFVYTSNCKSAHQVSLLVVLRSGVMSQSREELV